MLPVSFDATEYGGTGSVKLQGSLDNEASWVDVTDYLAMTNRILHLTVADGEEVDTGMFLVGESYAFRLIDQDGITVSNIIYYTIPPTGPEVAGEDDDSVTGENGEIIEGE